MFLYKASITTPPNAEAAVEDQGSSSIPPPARADVEKEKKPAEPEAKSKHQVSDAKHQVIIPSKKLTSLAPTKAASKAVPRDPDAAGDVDVSDDSATTTSNHGGSGSDTNGPRPHRLRGPREQRLRQQNQQRRGIGSRNRCRPYGHPEPETFSAGALQHV